MARRQGGGADGTGSPNSTMSPPTVKLRKKSGPAAGAAQRRSSGGLQDHNGDSALGTTGQSSSGRVGSGDKVRKVHSGEMGPDAHPTSPSAAFRTRIFRKKSGQTPSGKSDKPKSTLVAAPAMPKSGGHKGVPTGKVAPVAKRAAPATGVPRVCAASDTEPTDARSMSPVDTAATRTPQPGARIVAVQAPVPVVQAPVRAGSGGAGGGASAGGDGGAVVDELYPPVFADECRVVADETATSGDSGIHDATGDADPAPVVVAPTASVGSDRTVHGRTGSDSPPEKADGGRLGVDEAGSTEAGAGDVWGTDGNSETSRRVSDDSVGRTWSTTSSGPGSDDACLQEQPAIAVQHIPFHAIIRDDGNTCLGSGSYGTVYRALVVAPRPGEALSYVGIGKAPVAVKCLHDKFTDGNRDKQVAALKSEALIVASVPAHVNVMKLHGISMDTTMAALVLELCEGGDLHDAIHTHVRDPSPRLVTSWARQLAVGMAHLHAHNVYHRDLKPRNVMLRQARPWTNDAVDVVISDFGFAKQLNPRDASASNRHTEHGTALYMAREILRGEPTSKRSDSWSWGVIMWELLTGMTPYCHWANVSQPVIIYNVANGVKLWKPPADMPFPAPFADVITQCLDNYHRNRPSFEELAEALTSTSDNAMFAT